MIVLSDSRLKNEYMFVNTLNKTYTSKDITYMQRAKFINRFNNNLEFRSISNLIRSVASEKYSFVEYNDFLHNLLFKAVENKNSILSGMDILENNQLKVK